MGPTKGQRIPDAMRDADTSGVDADVNIITNRLTANAAELGIAAVEHLLDGEPAALEVGNARKIQIPAIDAEARRCCLQGGL